MIDSCVFHHKRTSVPITPLPIYTAANCNAAYQLNWSLSIFWTAPAASEEWLPALKQQVEPDGVRVLEHRFLEGNTSQFLLSTRPGVTPLQFVRSIKGRLQHIVRQQMPKAFHRNYAFRSTGSARQDIVDRYIASQVENHPLVAVDPRLSARFEQLQIHRPEVDLSQPRRNSYGQYWYNLHLVLCNHGRWCELRSESLRVLHDRILGVAAKHQWLLARGGILPDHVHLEIECEPGVSPGEVALCFMNNIAHLYGMAPIIQTGYYVGTIGEYDRNACREV